MELEKQHLMNMYHDGNGNASLLEEANNVIDFEILVDDDDSTMTAEKIVKSLPSDVTLIVQNTTYNLKILESYRQLISEEMRVILQKEGHKSYNFRRYAEILRKITTAIRLKTDFVRDLFHRLTNTTPDNIARTSYSTVVHYQRSLLDYQQILTEKHKRLQQELHTLQHVLTKVGETFLLLRRRAQEISELLSSITAEEIASYPPQELEEFRAILESSLDVGVEQVEHAEESRQTGRYALMKVLEAIGIQALSVKENRKYQEILNEIENYLGPEKTIFVTALLNQFTSMSPRDIARKYDATMIKHYLLILSHFTLLLESQNNLHILEQYNETSKRISEALSIKLNPYKEQLGLRLCDELAGIHPDELAAYQPYERIREFRKVLEASIAASEDDENAEDVLVRHKTLVKVLEAEGIQILMWEEPEKHKKYQELLGHIEQNLVLFKDEFLKERLTRFAGLTAQEIAQKYRVNTIKHNVLLLARLSLLLNMQENVDVMFEYYTVSKNIFEALNLKLEESKNYREEMDAFRLEAKKVLLESDLFRTLSTSAIERIVDRFELQEYSKNTIIIQKGQKGDAFYVIKQGSVTVGIPSKGGKEIELAILRTSDCFGEMSLLTGNPASASITSIEDVQLLKLSEERFNDILLEYPVLNRYFHRILSERLNFTSAKAQGGEFHKGLVGKLSTISLEELIQTLYTANKTGILTIDNQNDKGKIFIKNGLVIHAMTKNLKGEQAFFRLMTWHDASFRFMPGEVNVERTVTMNVHGLLLEAMKRIDDMRQIKHL
ncbi:putative Crp/Fnr family transcriptional regulator [Candidatus Vecturithrix granuli]|uniref:Putative Crp/Fnr family transcriptional regulator n=1 Tax=Vecturithrix granuli TaxID=1499967 RepID=A0A0S6W5W2_VECG1|nr:putative Crp/Fnr family transcriptional regulator [Candidatus Vecturithrix granuli]